MSLQLTVDYTVPEQTARVAQAAFPKGTLCLQLYDHLGVIFQDQDFADVFPGRGQPAKAPFRLALVTVLPYVEGLSDRQAANAVRSRMDWKYLLCLELEDPGFDFSVLCEFRDRLLNGGIEHRLLEQLLAILKAHKLVKGRVRARTDSTHVVAAVRQMNRLELVIETVRATLNVLATVMPEWVRHTIPTDWVERYGARAENFRLPEDESQRIAYAEQVGGDGYRLLEALWSESAPTWLREVPAVKILRQIWIHHFIPVDGGGARWRKSGELPPGALHINSPYDAEARYSKKRDKAWLGYKIHMTESCDEVLPHLITQVQTTSAVVGDNDAIPAIHETLEAAELLPDTHLVDTGYMNANNLVESRKTYGVDLFGPVAGNYQRQYREGHGFDLSQFTIDWQTQRVTCPNGKVSPVLRPMRDRHGHEVLHTMFERNDCSPCKDRSRCTSSAARRRTITVRPQPLHEALNTARERQKTDDFKEQYKQRAGIEGTMSQGVRAFGLRRSRYCGLAKTRLQHIAIAVAVNFVRLGAWFDGIKPGATRQSAFVKAMAPVLASV